MSYLLRDKYPAGCVLLSVILLQSCISNNTKNSPTIAELQPVAAVDHENTAQLDNIRPQLNFEVDKQKRINSFRQLVSITPRGEQFGKETQRLADLELEASMDDQLSNDASIAQRGEQQAMSAIQRYESYLKTYPDRTDNDLILYQLSRAYALNAEPDKAQDVMNQLVRDFPQSTYIDEVQFRLGESYFVSASYAEAEQAYSAVVNHYPDSIFYEKAIYKLGWSQFKQNKNIEAINSYVRLLDLKQNQQQFEDYKISDSISRSDRELVDDVLRVVSLSFSYLDETRSDNTQPISRYFSRNGNRAYEPLLYAELAELYLSKERITDAADVYLSYGEYYPLSVYAPMFHGRAIAIYKKSKFASLLLPEKENFVNKYNVGTAFWQQQDEATRLELQPVLTGHMRDIAEHYHASARSSVRTGKKASDYKLAARWYQRYLDTFPTDSDAAEINFLLAESRYDAGQFALAITEYEKTAYFYPTHKNSSEAAYAALIAYNKLYLRSEEKDRAQINDRLIESSVRFSLSFPNDIHMPAVLLSAAEQLYQQKKYSQSIVSADRLVNNPQLDLKIKHSALVLIAHSNFALQNYPAAEKNYLRLINNMPENDKDRKNMIEQLASSIYKQAEQERNNGNHQLAAAHFLRVAKMAPSSSICDIADYDAATEYVALAQWDEVITQLEAFRQKYIKQEYIKQKNVKQEKVKQEKVKQEKWNLGVTQKLALAYNNTAQYAKAAAEMETLISLSPASQHQELLWQAAELYRQAGNQKQTIALYKTYIKKYPQPLAKTIELRFKIAQYYLSLDDAKNYYDWLKTIIKADAKGGKQRTDRSRYLAATAQMELVRPVHQRYSGVKLTTPLKKSLKKKKTLMKQSIDAYTKAAKYQVEEVTTAATYNIAEIYREFASALMVSERPKKLNEEELEEYNYLLEDQAYPFEEKAINIHEKNLSRIPKGSFDESIKNSLAVLAKMMPFRYGKNEVTDSYVK